MSEPRTVRSEAERLVRVMTDWLADDPKTRFEVVDDAYRSLRDVLASEVPKLDCCQWKHDPDGTKGLFITGCGRYVCSEDDPEDWEATYCQYCGKPFQLPKPNCLEEEMNEEQMSADFIAWAIAHHNAITWRKHPITSAKQIERRCLRSEWAAWQAATYYAAERAGRSSPPSEECSKP